MAKFSIGAEIDSALTTTLVHEMFLCTNSFDLFASLAARNILGARDKRTKILCHDAYARFLSHLFEFYVGCIQRDRGSTSSVDSGIIDRTLTVEVRKLLKNKVDAIKGGYAPSWENHVSVYQVEVPDEFGVHFRKIRNRTAHASIKRSNPVDDLTLAEFYRRYHGFVYLLYRSGQRLWRVDNIEAHHWRAIEEFDLSVARDHEIER